MAAIHIVRMDLLPVFAVVHMNVFAVVHMSVFAVVHMNVCVVVRMLEVVQKKEVDQVEGLLEEVQVEDRLAVLGEV